MWFPWCVLLTGSQLLGVPHISIREIPRVENIASRTLEGSLKDSWKKYKTTGSLLGYLTSSPPLPTATSVAHNHSSPYLAFFGVLGIEPSAL
jgi:hypothetical protein